MSASLWILGAIAAAVLLDALTIWIWRRRHGRRRIAWPWHAWPSPPWLAPVLITAGGISLLLGQSFRSQYPTSGTRLVSIFNIAGLLAVLFGVLSVRASKVASGSAKSSKGSRQVSRKKQTSKSASRRSPGLELAAILAGAIVLLLSAQAMGSFLPESDGYWSTIYTGLGLALFVLSALSLQRQELLKPVGRYLDSIGKWIGVRRFQVVLLALSPILGLAAWIAAGNAPIMRSPAMAVGLWLLATGSVIVGSAQSLPKLRWRSDLRGEALVVGALFLGALILRIVAVGRVPWLLTGDEASMGLSAVEFIDGVRDNIFGTAFLSFPSLYFSLQAGSIQLLGQTTEALRLTSALAGALTVLALYWLLREIFDRWVATAAGFYLAFFHFHIHFSRLGLNNIWDGLFISLISAAFLRGWIRKDRLSFVVAGLAFGLSQYFYTSSRFLFLLFPIWLVLAAVRDWKGFRDRVPDMVIMGLASAVVAFPLAVYYLGNQAELFAPMKRVYFLDRMLDIEMQASGRSAFSVLLNQFKQSALAFTGADLRHWYQPSNPMLFAIPAALFLMGLVLLFLGIRRLRNAWIVLWLAGSIVIGALTESTPAAQRYVFAAPAVSAVIALALVQIARWMIQSVPNWKWAFISIAAGLLAVAAWQDVSFYFGDYSANRKFGDVNTETANVLAQMLQEYEDGTSVYFLGGRMGYYSHSTVPYLAPGAKGYDVLGDPQSFTEWNLSEPTLFVVLPERASDLLWLYERFPGGSSASTQGKDTELFITYEVGSS